jgi:DNA-binding FadR family transcriptional regulator
MLGTVHNLTHTLTHTLGTHIIQGDFDHSRFPSEAEISQRYQVSRSATREAIKMLTAKGLLASKPKQGIRILPASQWNLFDTDVLSWMLTQAPSANLLCDFMQMRLSFEPMAAALAAHNARAEQLAKIETALARMEQQKTNSTLAVEADIDFHCAVLDASNNRFFKRLKAFSSTALRASITHTNQLKGVPSADVMAHYDVYTAIAEGDRARAQMRMQQLIAEALALITKKALAG